MPIDLTNIQPLSDFQRNAKDHIRKLKKSGRPVVLTVNGQAQVVVQSAEAYQKLLDGQELVQSLRGIMRGLDQAKRGQAQPMREFLEALAKKREIPLK